MRLLKSWKKGFALFLISAMLCQLLSPVAQVSAADIESEREVAAQLLELEEQYPEGAFAFGEAQIDVKEGKEAELVIVRMGNRDKEAKVSLRAVDVSAKYGTDYVLTVKEGSFFSKTLKGDAGSQTLMESLVETESVEDTNVSFEEEAGEVTIDEEKDADKELRTLEGKSSLQSAKDMYLGEESERIDWTELSTTEEDYEQMEALLEQGDESLEIFAEGIDGIKYDMTFKAGEYKKVIQIETIRDNVCESQEQVFFALFGAENAVSGDVVTAYANIEDANEKEESVFEVGETDIWVERSQKSVEIPIKRVAGEQQNATVVVGTCAETAKNGMDYVSVKEELFFMQGQTEQIVEIPLVSNSNTTGEVVFYVGLEGQGSSVSEGRESVCVHIVEPGQLTVRMMSARASSKNPKYSINKEIWASGGNTKSMTLDNEFELSTAESITVEYDLTTNGRSWTTGSGCNEESHYSNNVTMTMKVEDRSQTVTSSGNKSGSVTISVNGSDKAQVSKAKLSVSTSGTSGNDNSHVKIKSVTINYIGYRFKINNATSSSTSKTSYSVYEEKTYLESSAEYKTGKTLMLGDVFFKSGDEYVNEMTCYAPTKLTAKAILNEKAKTSMGVAVSSDNTYCAGVYIKKGNNKTEIIPLSELTFDKAFVKKYANYLSNGNTFDIYPVIQPKASSVYLSLSEGNTYTYKRGAGEVINCTMLDTVLVEAYSKSDSRSIVNVTAYPFLKNKETSVVDKKIAATMTENLQKGGSAKSNDGVYTLGKLNTSVVVPKVANNYETVYITPTTNLFVCAQTDVYTVEIKANPKSSDTMEKVLVETIDKDGNPQYEYSYKGAISYLDGETLLGTNPGADPLLISGVKKGQLLKFFGITVKDVNGKEYKTQWLERTGDTDGDNSLNTDEEKALGNYKLMSPITSNMLNFTIGHAKTSLLYGFKEADMSVTGVLQGNIFVEEEEIFTGQTTIVPLKGASVLADDQSTTSGENKDKGSGTYKTDGYYYMERTGWENTDYLYVNVLHQGVTYSYVQNPDVASSVTIPTNKPIYVKEDGAKVYGADGSLLSAQSVANGDTEYTIELSTASTDAAVVPKVAILRFYDKSGILKHTIRSEQSTVKVSKENGGTEVVTDTGIFEFTFNPKDLAVTAGSTLTVQFEDQNGKAYYEHPTGISFKETLGIMSFVNSMSLTANTGSVLGVIDSVFDLGWSGNFDDIANETTETTVVEKDEYGDLKETTVETTSKTISFGFGISEDYSKEKNFGTIAAKASALAEADQDVVDAQNKLRDMKKEGASDEKIEKQKKKISEAQTKAATAKEGYDNFVKEENEGKKKTEVDLAFNASVNVAFALNITLVYDTEVQQWYFRDMVLSVDFGAGVSTKIAIATPVGLDITLTISVSLGDSNSIMTVSERGTKRFYIQKSASGDTLIDVFDFDMDDADRTLDYRGVYHIAPTLKLEGKVGSNLLSTSVGADISALFDLWYYTDPETDDVQLLKINGGLTIEILGFEKRWDMGTTEINLGGNSRSRALMRAMSLEDSMYDSVDTLAVDSRAYLQNRSGWNSGNTKLRSRAMTSFNEQVLLNGVYENVDVQFVALEDDSVLAVYVDSVPTRSAVNNTAVYYTVYNQDGSGVWKEPRIIHDDGTIDDAPAVADLGDKGIMVAWSSADKVFDDDADVITVLESRNIETALFNKDTFTFGDVKAVTKTTASDLTGDVQPNVTYYQYDSKERMVITYSKNEYTRTNHTEGVIGDAVNPYSVVAYKYYDFEKDCWRDTYTEAEKTAIMSGNNLTESQFVEYESQWYGQGFLSVAPVVTIEETLNDGGYWEENPVIRENTSSVSPTVVDSDVVTYNGLGLFAYVMDIDANLQTDADRDVYLQIYDYADDTFTHPIMVTADSSTDSQVKFARMGGDTYLAWISDDEIQVLNISVAIREGAYIKKTTNGGQEYYYLNKSLDSGYIAPYTVASYKTDAEVATRNDEAAAKAIHDFDIQSNDNYLYVLWTESDSVLKDGIEEGSDEAKNSENYVTERQIYGSRMSVETGSWSGRTRISDTNAANYGDLDFLVKQDGTLLIMAQRSFAKTVTEDNYAFSMIDETTSSLVSMSYIPTQDVAITELDMDMPVEGEETIGNISIKNNGFTDASDLVLKLTDEKGNVLLNETISRLESGKLGEYEFAYILSKTGKEVTDYEVTAEIIQDGVVLSRKVLEGTCTSEVVMSDFKVEQNESRELATLGFVVSNPSSISSTKQEIEILTEDGQLTTVEVPVLVPGETKTISKQISIKDDMFSKGVNEVGNKTETLSLKAKLGDTVIEQQIVRTTPSDIWEKFQSITSATADKIIVKENDNTTAKVDIQSPLFAYDEYTTYENYGLTVVWEVEDSSIATVTSEGIITGVKEGKTMLRGTVMPSGYLVTFDGDDDAQYLIDELSLTSDMFRTIETEVVVEEGDIPAGGQDSSSQITDGTMEPEQDSVGTGDTTAVWMWLLLIAVCGSIVVLLVIKKKKENQE